MEFTKSEIAELIGIKPRRVLDWTTRGYMKPYKPAATDKKGKRQGKISYYNEANAVQGRVLEKLSESGISLSKFADIFNGDVALRLNSLATYYLTADLNHFSFKEMVFSLVIVGNCERVTIETTEINEPIPIRAVRHDLQSTAMPEIDDFLPSVLVINLNKILWEIKGKLQKI